MIYVCFFFQSYAEIFCGGILHLEEIFELITVIQAETF